MPIKLKLLRSHRGLTLEQLAQKTDLTRSFLSKIERGLSSPSIDSALRISKALNVSVEALFDQDGMASSVSIMRRSSHHAAQENEYLTLVAGHHASQDMRAFIVQPSSKVGRRRLMTHHEGEEILFVLKGKMELRIGQRKEMLNAGDCVHFDSAVPHKLTAVGTAPCSALVVISGAGKEDAS